MTRRSYEPFPSFDNPACKGVDASVFVTRPGKRHSTVVQAKKICGSCPHEQPCLEWALANVGPADGMTWGGKTDQERRAIRLSRFKAREATS